MDNEANIYRSSMFSVLPTGNQFRTEFGEHAFIIKKHDDTEVWTLRADSAQIQFGYPEGQVQESELLESSREILSKLA